jgi:hypothetical protein
MEKLNIKCLVIMPFGIDHANSIYENWIRSAVEELKYREGITITCHRADKTNRPGEIIIHILENIAESEIVIADLTGQNPNVFYELGVRHTLSNNTILLVQDINDIPFDLINQRIIEYKYDPDELLKLKKEIQDAIISILSSPDQIDNPVRKFIYDKELKKFFNQNSTPPGFDVIKNLVTEVHNLKKYINQQTIETRQLFESILKPSQNEITSETSKEYDLKFFEGAWYTEDTKSHYYPRVINEKLYIPYCYHGDNYLVAHFCNCKLFEDQLIMEFHWFEKYLPGFSLLRIIDENTLKGGWWNSTGINKHTTVDDLLDMNKRGMIEFEWKRLIGKKAPEWVEKYFENLSFYNKD